MDVMKKFLDDICRSNDTYSYEKVDNLAEMFREGDEQPIAIIEWVYSTGSYSIRFRMGLSSLDIANISRDMAEQNSSLIFNEDFLIDPDYGYLYGAEATMAFMKSIMARPDIETEDSKFEKAINSAMYIVHEPIFTYGSGYRGRTNIEKLWDADDY